MHIVLLVKFTYLEGLFDQAASITFKNSCPMLTQRYTVLAIIWDLGFILDLGNQNDVQNSSCIVHTWMVDLIQVDNPTFLASDYVAKNV